MADGIVGPPDDGRDEPDPARAPGRGELFHLATATPGKALCGRPLGPRSTMDECCPECWRLAVELGAFDGLLEETDMNVPVASSLRQLVRQAERFGTDNVWAIGCRTLEPDDQGMLALHLRRIDPGWRLSRAEAMDLAARLATAGVGDAEIRRMAGISQPTVRKARSRPALLEGREG